MASLTLFITTRLKLKVNALKSAVAPARVRTFLGFSFTHGIIEVIEMQNNSVEWNKQYDGLVQGKVESLKAMSPDARAELRMKWTGQRPKRRLADTTLVRFRARVRMLTRRVRGVSLRQMVQELAAHLQGWRAYFGFCETPTILRRLDKWIRRRLPGRRLEALVPAGHAFPRGCGSATSTRRMPSSRLAATAVRGVPPSPRAVLGAAGHILRLAWPAVSRDSVIA
jgi:hypothetical protein